MKVCSDCGAEKPEAEFARNRGYVTKRCKPCYSDYVKSLPSYQDRERVRDQKLRARYGISLGDYLEMLRGQNGACAVCGGGGKLHVDHCHETGRVRGLLCGSCNRALGLLKDDIDSLKKAIDYLQKGSDG